MPKIYAACGAVGFVLSFVVGIFSGASFLLILVRALIFGAVFAALAVLFGFLQKRFAPDLFDTNAAVAAPIPKARASKLDITISDNKDAPSEENELSVPDFMKNRSRGKSGAASASGVGRREEPNAAGSASESPQSAPADDAPSKKESSPSAAKQGSAMPNAASLASSNEEEEGEEYGVEEEEAPLPPPLLERAAAENQSPSINADIDTMAKAIRTVLAKEN